MKAAIKKAKTAETKRLNKEFDAELKRRWVWGNSINLTTAIEVPIEQVFPRIPKLNACL